MNTFLLKIKTKEARNLFIFYLFSIGIFLAYSIRFLNIAWLDQSKKLHIFCKKKLQNLK